MQSAFPLVAPWHFFSGNRNLPNAAAGGGGPCGGGPCRGGLVFPSSTARAPPGCVCVGGRGVRALDAGLLCAADSIHYLIN